MAPGLEALPPRSAEAHPPLSAVGLDLLLRPYLPPWRLGLLRWVMPRWMLWVPLRWMLPLRPWVSDPLVGESRLAPVPCCPYFLALLSAAAPLPRETGFARGKTARLAIRGCGGST